MRYIFAFTFRRGILYINYPVKNLSENFIKSPFETFKIISKPDTLQRPES